MKKIKKCDICKNDVIIDKWGNGTCKICLWSQNKDCLDFPDIINPPNFCTFNEAKNLWIKNQIYTPTFERMLELIERGLDFSFKYKNKRYLVEKHENYTIWQEETNLFLEFENIDELKNAKLNNIPLKELWKNIKAIRYEC